MSSLRLPFPALRAALLVAAAALLAPAADFGALKPQGYVSDFANVIDPAMRQQLETFCASVQRSTGAQMALVTLPSLEGEPIEDVANLLYRKWGVGDKKNNEGLLLLLSIRDRRSRLEVGYGLEPYLTDGYAGMTLREMRPSLRTGNYGQALADGARAIAQTIAKKKGVQLTDVPPRRRASRGEGGFPWEVGLVVGAGLLALLFFGGRSGPRYPGGGGGGGFLAGMILGQLMNSGSRTSSHGGFGGYDSGDSFGGFGGGDSGGGGASSDW